VRVTAREDGGIMMSMSMTGFAARSGMDVLPTCSIEMYEMPRRIVSNVALVFWNSAAQDGSYGSIMIFTMIETVIAARMFASVDKSSAFR
jgi:hypothetical protein